MIEKFYNNLVVLLNADKCILKWSANKTTSSNIGDAINPFLFKKIFGKEVINIKHTFNLGITPVFSFVGSVLDNSAVKNLVVVGSGFKSADSKLQRSPAKVIATRGPLTRKKLIEQGIAVPKVYGDPAILLPRYLNSKTKKRSGVGFIPHYVDKEEAVSNSWRNKEGIKEIDVFTEMSQFVEQIETCEFTISSSLHGIILSHAYGIPSVWVKLSDKLIGGNFKFDDYYASVNLEVPPIYLTEQHEIEDLRKLATLPDIEPVAERLLSHIEATLIKL